MDKSPRVVDTIAALRALTIHHHRDLVLVAVAANEEWYVFDATSTGVDDGFVFVRPTDTRVALPGRWKLVE